MVKAKKFIHKKLFEGVPKETDLQLVEEELPPLKDGEFLAEAVYLSVDPYMRIFGKDFNIPPGSTVVGSQVAKITESKNDSYKVGQHIVAPFGWRTRTISTGKEDTLFEYFLIPDDVKGVPLSYFLGVLGMPGFTAYFGFLEICQPKAGETVVVTGAAGAVGSIVGQIAKIKGCTVIGVAGSTEKGQWLANDLNFDHFINYKDQDFDKKLSEAAPKGIDCYFDNVGGEISSKILRQMNMFGRISVCGSISGYNDVSPSKATTIQSTFVSKQLKMEGFMYNRWAGRQLEVINQHTEWIKQGKLKYRETETEGFENMFEGFVEMLGGKNFGKAVIKA